MTGYCSFCSASLMPQFKVGVASVVVDGLLAQKDRLALLSYQNTMTPNSRFDNMASID